MSWPDVAMGTSVATVSGSQNASDKRALLVLALVIQPVAHSKRAKLDEKNWGKSMPATWTSWCATAFASILGASMHANGARATMQPVSGLCIFETIGEGMEG